MGCPDDSIICKSSALTAPGKDDEDEFVSDVWTALPLLPSSPDDLVSILLKALIVDFCICCWIRLKERNELIDNCGTRVETPNCLYCQKTTILRDKSSCYSYNTVFRYSVKIRIETPKNRREQSEKKHAKS